MTAVLVSEFGIAEPVYGRWSVIRDIEEGRRWNWGKAVCVVDSGGSKHDADLADRFELDGWAVDFGHEHNETTTTLVFATRDAALKYYAWLKAITDEEEFLAADREGGKFGAISKYTSFDPLSVGRLEQAGFRNVVFIRAHCAWRERL